MIRCESICAPTTISAQQVIALGHRRPPHVWLICQTCGGRQVMKKNEKEVVRTAERALRDVPGALVRVTRQEI